MASQDPKEFNWPTQTWDVIDSAFADDDSLITHQLESFNNMIESTIPALMMHNMPIKVSDIKTQEDAAHDERSFKILKCGISKPILYQNGQGYRPMLPSEARNRNLTYAAPLYVDFEYTRREGDQIEKVVETKVCVGKIPIMVGSKYCHLYGRSKTERTALNECPYDRGGYFIIKGSEKVVISQERPVENIISCFEESDVSKPYECRAEVKSTIDQRFFVIKVAIVRLTKYHEATARDKSIVPGHKLLVALPYGRRPIPLFVIFKAFGVTSDEEIFDYLLDKESAPDRDFVNLIAPSARDAHNILTQADAIRYVANSINVNITEKTVQEAVDKAGKTGDDVSEDVESTSNMFRMKYAKDLLNREFLPHVGNDPTKKLRFLSLMVQKLLHAKLSPDLYSDRDKLTNKRLDLPGTLVFQIFRNYFQKMLKDVKAYCVKAIRTGTADKSTGVSASQEIRRIIQKSNIQNKLCYALSTGNWYTNRSQATSAAKKGVAQVLQRLSYIGTLSNLRRITSPLERAGSKHEPPRRYHGTQPPKICPPETPEGAQVGSVKNLSLMTHVSIETSSYPVVYCLKMLGMIPIIEASSSQVQRLTKVLVNGDFVGLCSTLEETVRIVTLLKFLRRTGVLNKFISIAWHQDFSIIQVLTDGGRYSTPYYVIDADGHFQMDRWVRAYEDQPLPGLNALTEKLLDNKGEEIAAEDVGPVPYNVIYRNNGEYNPQLEAAIEYLDTDEEETCMIAITPEQLFTSMTFRQGSDNKFYGHLTPVVKFPNSVTENAKETEMLTQRSKMRDQEVDLKDDLLQRRERQDAKAAKDQEHEDLSLIDRIRARLDDDSKTVFNVCVQSIEIVDPGKEIRAVAITLKDLDLELTSSQFHLLTNLNRFISRDFVAYTHCMLHPAIIHGVVATNIPFPDHNQSPRNCYQSSMGKQAVGVFATNYSNRMDTMANVLVYPQVPLVATRTSKHTRMDKLHHGYNAMIAIACYTGYNQEDSLIGSGAAAQRGAYNTAYYRTYSATLQKLPSQDASESFEVPPERTIGRKVGAGGKDRYHAIQRNFGKMKTRKPELPRVGAIVHGNDIIIPKSKKISSKKKTGAGTDTLYSDCSVTVKPSETGVVDKVIPNEHVTNNEDEDAYQFVKVRICERRETEIGDKFASRAAQKGTEGILLNAADMMFNQFGMSPDKIMNPQAVPSRMTQGQLIESICAKEGVVTGKFHDATPFTEFDLMSMRNLLGRTGYDNTGDELMYNGHTGELLETPVTFWPTYYQRLKHMVGDKMHARGLGPIQALTKQPAEGRSRMGGLRMGEMERDCMIAHGCALFLKEKMMDASDIFEVFVSEQKQTVIAANPNMGIFQHGTEEIYGKDDIARVQMPYAMNLFRNELRTGLVDMKLILE
jgi:DNA-directed RNA polymerase beta subunit